MGIIFAHSPFLSLSLSLSFDVQLRRRSSCWAGGEDVKELQKERKKNCSEEEDGQEKDVMIVSLMVRNGINFFPHSCLGSCLGSSLPSSSQRPLTHYAYIVNTLLSMSFDRKPLMRNVCWDEERERTL